MTEVPQIYQSDDPRQALLGTLIGNSDWIYENQFGVKNQGNQYDASGKLTSTGEGNLGKEEGNEYGNYTQREAERTEAEPGVYRGNANRANRGGLLNSGINRQRMDTIAGHFANQRYASQHQHLEATQRFGTQRQEGTHSHEAEVATKLAEARTQAWQRTQEQKQQQQATGLTSVPQGTYGGWQPSAAEPYPGYRARVSGNVKGGFIQWSHNPKVRAEQAKRGY